MKMAQVARRWHGIRGTRQFAIALYRGAESLKHEGATTKNLSKKAPFGAI